MSGIEIAGLVLGGFPILLNCLEYYRQGFEPLEEWWNFRTSFIAFVDDISHQMMRYRDNMFRLLDPIVTDNESLNKLVADPADPRWSDGSLDGPLERRLSIELGRFRRIIERMHTVVNELNKLLQIENGQVSWVGSSHEKPWQWHFKRIQISFSKGKHKKVKKLESHNQELQEILGCSERITLISDKRKSSEPVSHLEKIRQHACCVHNALKRQWKCNNRCRGHKANLSLRAEATSVSLSVTFIISGNQGMSSKAITQEVWIQPKEGSPAVISTDINDVSQTSSLTTLQQTLVEQDGLARSKPNFISRLSQGLRVGKSSLRPSLDRSGTQKSPSSKKSVSIRQPIPVIAITSPSSSAQVVAGPAHSMNNTPGAVTRSLVVANPIPSNTSAPVPIADLCSFLANNEPISGVIQDDYDRQLELSKTSKGHRMATSNKARLLPLPELLSAYYKAAIDISRQRRFEMAAHIASALLQTHLSPWLSTKWSKQDFYFLADMDSQSLHSSYPFVSRSFPPSPCDEEGDLLDDGADVPGTRQRSEEDARTCLLTVGIIILELIFGHNIEDCSFRRDYYGKDDKPNDQTDICTARKWAKKVLGECGPQVEDVVRRCLDCSFGPKPSFADVRFREAVYECVIKPLASYSNAWPEVMP